MHKSREAIDEQQKAITKDINVGDGVHLPFGEFGKVVGIREMLWMTKYYVKITISDGWNEVGEVVDFFKWQLK